VANKTINIRAYGSEEQNSSTTEEFLRKVK